MIEKLSNYENPVDRINEIIDYINKEEVKDKEHKGILGKVMEMREKEHKVTMETAKLTKAMIEKMSKDIGNNK